eukprot:1690803-Rhodomonas_salina.2
MPCACLRGTGGVLCYARATGCPGLNGDVKLVREAEVMRGMEIEVPSPYKPIYRHRSAFLSLLLCMCLYPPRPLLRAARYCAPVAWYDSRGTWWAVSGTDLGVCGIGSAPHGSYSPDLPEPDALGR